MFAIFDWGRGVSFKLGVAAALLTCHLAHGAQPKPGHLQIHYISVGQGGATLIIGPNGTMIMYDFGRVAGNKFLVKYLQQVVGLEAGDHIHYAMVSHGDKDHYVGYKDVVELAGIDISRANYEPGSNKERSKSMFQYWLNPAKKTRAGAFKPIPVGLRIPLGDGAEAHVVAANGVVLNDETRPVIRNENDRSIALFVKYGSFTYVLDGDLGGGKDPCTSHQTDQINVQERVARALVKNELLAPNTPLSVMHVAHHGSESSTPAEYFNMLKPRVALVSVGADQGGFLHPRVDVVEQVLLDIQRPSCVTAPPVMALLQTGSGANRSCSATGCTSFAGADVGNIVVKTDGVSTFTIEVAKEPDKYSARFIKLKGKPPWTVSLP